MLPLTGTTDAAHMREDLGSRALALTPDEVRAVETIAVAGGR
jgi:aryl-alcohol dehydrogenase-like predicted oxidoreductase